jgi:hypothetical protein
MRTLLTCTAIASLFILSAACAKKQDDTQPSATPTATAGYPPQAGYPPGYPPPQGTYAQPYPAQYPPPTSTSQYPPAPAPTTPGPGPMPAPTGAPPATGQMAVPGPIAFQCQNDVQCGTHHCNVQYGKCAFPCASAFDCISPNQCIAGLCVPAPPQPH